MPKGNPAGYLFPSQPQSLGVIKSDPLRSQDSMTSTKPVAGRGDKGPMEEFAAMGDPGGPLGVNPNLQFKPTMAGAKSALRDTGIAALEMGSAGLAPGYAAAETLATELVGEEGFMAQGMHQDQARRNEELAIVVGAMVKSGHLPVDQAITLMESLPKSGSAEDFSLKSAFALGAQMGASAAPIASFVQSLVTTSAQAAAARAAGKGFEAQKIRDSRGNVYDSEGEFPPTVPDPLRPVSPRNPDIIADTTKQGGAKFSTVEVADDLADDAMATDKLKAVSDNVKEMGLPMDRKVPVAKGWVVRPYAGRDGSVKMAIVHEGKGAMDYPVRYEDGTLGYDTPENVPKSVREWLAKNWDTLQSDFSARFGTTPSGAGTSAIVPKVKPRN